MPQIKDGFFVCDCNNKLCRIPAPEKLKDETGAFIDCKKCGRRVEIKKPVEKVDLFNDLL